MTKREAVIKVLQGGIPDIVPSYGECPMDVTVLKHLMLPATGDEVEDAIAFAEFFDNSMVDVGIGMRQETLEKTESSHTYAYETGAVWVEKYKPTFCREATRYPVNTVEEALSFRMPVCDDGTRIDWKTLKKRIARFKDRGYFVQGGVMGAWAGCYYYVAPFDTMLEWMLTEPEAAAHIFAEVTRFSLESAEILLSCGVDCIFTVSDLGTSISTLFSPELFDRHIFPWLSSLSGLCHARGAFLHLHSHGHIESFMDGIVASGVDLINPVGPSDYNDLSMFKEKWGSQISFLGGISTTIAEMSDEEMRLHVSEVMRTGCRGGRFFPRTESGIPPMPLEKTLLYLQTLRQARAEGYTQA